jgi:hypothetical protein
METVINDMEDYVSELNRKIATTDYAAAVEPKKKDRAFLEGKIAGLSYALAKLPPEYQL